jgi:hypothetical protein
MRFIVVVATLLPAVLLAGRAAAIGVPLKAPYLKGYLVTAYEPCTAPDRSLAPDRGALPACAARRGDGECGLAKDGYGQFLVKVTGDDLIVVTKLSGLESTCEGAPLETKLDLVMSSDDCSVDDCTTQAIAAPAGTCVVVGGKFRSKQLVGPSLMNGLALAAPDRVYGLEVRGVRVRQTGGDAAALVAGFKLPKPPAACDGMSVGGYCWYLGGDGQSCATVCGQGASTIGDRDLCRQCRHGRRVGYLNALIGAV